MRSIRFLLAAAVMLAASTAFAQGGLHSNGHSRYRSHSYVSPSYENHGYGAYQSSTYYTPWGSASYNYSASSPYFPVYAPVYPVYTPPVYGSYYWWYSW
jgi:hypothetical protein